MMPDFDSTPKRTLKQRDTIPPLNTRIAKYEINSEKCRTFVQHFENCFKIVDENINVQLEIDLTHKN